MESLLEMLKILKKLVESEDERIASKNGRQLQQYWTN